MDMAMDGAVFVQTNAAHNEVVGRLMAAIASGDLAATVALLHPDVTFTGDANRVAPTAVRVIHGPDKVARFLFGLANRYGPAFMTSSEMALVNGELGAYTPGSPGDDEHQPRTDGDPRAAGAERGHHHDR